MSTLIDIYSFKMLVKLTFLLLLNSFVSIGCENLIKNNSNPITNFRRTVEEIDDSVTSSSLQDDGQGDLVTFLVENVKKIFQRMKETTETSYGTDVNASTADFKTTESDHYLYNTVSSNDDMTFDHFTFTNSIINGSDFRRTGSFNQNVITHQTKQLMFLDKEEKTTPFDNIDKSTIFNEPVSRRSCIFCDNVIYNDCYDPRNKLIPSILCEHEDDSCYTMHTPFGVIDRGCFNAYHNLTTYVCSNNLCNTIPISEMPYLFPTKHDWINNTIELTRERSIRKLTMKELSCIRCEVNDTTKDLKKFDSINCLQGNVELVQECREDEICAVMAVKTIGYIWRGCVKSPLYNYWWTFCNYDLCNYDTNVSIFDEMV